MTDLFSFADAHPNYRASDPITSRDAGRSAQWDDRWFFEVPQESAA